MVQFTIESLYPFLISETKNENKILNAECSDYINIDLELCVDINTVLIIKSVVLYSLKVKFVRLILD